MTVLNTRCASTSHSRNHKRPSLNDIKRISWYSHGYEILFLRVHLLYGTGRHFYCPAQLVGGFYAERPFGQAVVTGVYQSPRLYLSLFLARIRVVIRIAHGFSSCFAKSRLSHFQQRKESLNSLTQKNGKCLVQLGTALQENWNCRHLVGMG